MAKPSALRHRGNLRDRHGNLRPTTLLDEVTDTLRGKMAPLGRLTGQPLPSLDLPAS